MSAAPLPEHVRNKAVLKNASLEAERHGINTALPLSTIASLATLAELLRQLSKLAVKFSNFNDSTGEPSASAAPPYACCALLRGQS
eukprot:scaffold228433_cov21-Prasinocladus_malaysianus.AAC.1